MESMRLTRSRSSANEGSQGSLARASITSLPVPPPIGETGTRRARGLALLVRRKLWPACFTLASTSPKCRASSVEVMGISIQKTVKYRIMYVKVQPAGAERSGV